MTKDDIIKTNSDKKYLLKQICTRIYPEEITEISLKLREMRDFVQDGNNNALGLALPQIGILKTGYVVKIKDKTIIMINPKIKAIGFKEVKEEGCLSEPGVKKLVLRYQSIEVKYSDENGFANNLSLGGLYARIVQHEQDHLNGILLEDK